MKKAIRIIVPILLSIVILCVSVWYLFQYDREFTRDMLLSVARYCESQGNHELATWFYGQAYSQTEDGEAVAIELAEQYKNSGNYTKAEYTLSNAIADGGGIDLYIALCKTYVEQDKLLDAVNMLNGITNPDIKQQLDSMRPAAPTASPEPAFYSQYISAEIHSESGTLYVNPNGQYPSVRTGTYTDAIPLKDGENTLYAIAVSDDGLVSPVSIFGYTIGGVIEKVDFADTTMEAEIRTFLEIDAGVDVYNNDLWTITEWTVPSGASAYDDLRHMTFLNKLVIENGVSTELSYISSLVNLEELQITNTTVSADVLKVIGSLPKLKHLTLANCDISDISALASCKELEYLDLNNNAIRDLSALASLSALTVINLQHNAVKDLTPMASLKSVTCLDVSFNALTTAAPLAGMVALTQLNANDNQLSTTSGIEPLTALTHLSLANNDLTSIAGLASCVNLEELSVSGNQLSDINALVSLVKIMNLDISHNQITKLPEFVKDCNLVNLYASHNKISDVKPLSGLHNLNNVDLDYNPELSSISALADCHTLIEVNVYGTKVTSATELTNQSIIVNLDPIQ